MFLKFQTDPPIPRIQGGKTPRGGTSANFLKKVEPGMASEKFKLSFYFKCPKCNLTYHGVEIPSKPGEIKFFEYPKCCIGCDIPLHPEIKENKV